VSPQARRLPKGAGRLRIRHFDAYRNRCSWKPAW